MTASPQPGPLRDRVIDSAIAVGKFPASRRGHYETLWAKDPTGTAVLIARLAPVAAAGGPRDPAPASRTEGSDAVIPARGGGFVRATMRPLDETGPLDYNESMLSETERTRIASATTGVQ